jgi:hypothetical protein
VIGVPLEVLVVMLIGIPAGVAVCFGALAFRRVAPLAYRCQRCDGAFVLPSPHGFPASCALCRSRDWNERR